MREVCPVAVPGPSASLRINCAESVDWTSSGITPVRHLSAIASAKVDSSKSEGWKIEFTISLQRLQTVFECLDIEINLQ